MGKDKPPRAPYAGSSLPDIFFNFFYVAALYNVSNILVKSPTGDGLLYFVGTLAPIVEMWFEKTCYGTQFVYGDTLWHRIFEVAMLVVLSSVVIHIQSVEILSNPSENVDMFAFCLALVISSLLSILRYFAYTLLEKGNPKFSKITAGSYAKGRLLSIVFYIPATVFAGQKFYGDEDQDVGDIGIIPIHLCLLGAALWFCYQLASYFCPDRNPLETNHPMNVGSYIHCGGEWTMLVLGGNVLAILLVEVTRKKEFFVTFYSIILLLILLQILHFRSQPHSDPDHALRRDKYAGFIWSILHQVYCGALLVVGVSCRLLLNETMEETQGTQRFLNTESHREPRMYRLLFEGGLSEFSQEGRQKRIADMFCFAMATVWLCADAMILLHNGYKNSMRRCMVQTRNSQYQWRERVFSLIPLRLSLIVVIATLSQYETAPEVVAVVGFVGMGLQHFGRTLFDFHFPPIPIFTAKEAEGDTRTIEEENFLADIEASCNETQRKEGNHEEKTKEKSPEASLVDKTLATKSVNSMNLASEYSRDETQSIEGNHEEETKEKSTEASLVDKTLATKSVNLLNSVFECSSDEQSLDMLDNQYNEKQLANGDQWSITTYLTNSVTVADDYASVDEPGQDTLASLYCSADQGYLQSNDFHDSNVFHKSIDSHESRKSQASNEPQDSMCSNEGQEVSLHNDNAVNPKAEQSGANELNIADSATHGTGKAKGAADLLSVVKGSADPLNIVIGTHDAINTKGSDDILKTARDKAETGRTVQATFDTSRSVEISMSDQRDGFLELTSWDEESAAVEILRV